MGFDKRGNMRLHCMTPRCDCEEYDAPKDGHNCDYCDCKPTRHRIKNEAYVQTSIASDQSDVSEHSFICIDDDETLRDTHAHYVPESDVLMKLTDNVQLFENEDLNTYGVVNVYGIFEENEHIYFSCAVCGVKLFMARSRKEASVVGLNNLTTHRTSIGHRFNMSVASAEQQAELHNRHAAELSSCKEFYTSTADAPKRSHVCEIAAMYERISLDGRRV